MDKLILKEKKISEFCLKKGWDVNKLTTNQMLVIASLIR